MVHRILLEVYKIFKYILEASRNLSKSFLKFLNIHWKKDQVWRNPEKLGSTAVLSSGPCKK